MLHIPAICIKDKQVFDSDMLTLIGKPLDVAKKLKAEGHKLIHIVDKDALAGLSTNLDIYDHLTYFINVEVECAPKEQLIMKLLSLKCRVVLEHSVLDLSQIREKKLLVAKISPPYPITLEHFHDVLLVDADEASVRRFSEMGKRVIVYEKDVGNLKSSLVFVWGVISTS